MDRNYYIDSLKKSNFKITPQRLTVIDYVRSHSPGHFTAEEIFNSIKSEEPTITLATVYNILKALQSSGTVKTFETSGSTWFETNTDFHGNFVCSNCGKIYDIGIDEEGILSNVEGSGYSVQEANLILKGICKECLLDRD